MRYVCSMIRSFTLEYWQDEGWFIGRLKEVPGVFSQGETLEELERNVKDAYGLMMAEEELPENDLRVNTKELQFEM